MSLTVRPSSSWLSHLATRCQPVNAAPDPPPHRDIPSTSCSHTVGTIFPPPGPLLRDRLIPGLPLPPSGPLHRFGPIRHLEHQDVPPGPWRRVDRVESLAGTTTVHPPSIINGIDLFHAERGSPERYRPSDRLLRRVVIDLDSLILHSTLTRPARLLHAHDAWIITNSAFPSSTSSRRQRPDVWGSRACASRVHL